MAERLFDTHCHLQSARLDADREALVEQAAGRGVAAGLIAGGSPDDWEKCEALAARFGWYAGLGTHPLATREVSLDAVEKLRDALSEARRDPESRVIAVAEIGIDGFDKTLDMARQEAFFAGQLKVARDFALPVSVHARHAVDQVAKWLRRIEVPGGVIHAFNGSEAQAQVFMKLGFRLGFGGAMTYAGSLRIRRLAASLPLSSIMLETDCPDMPGSSRRDAGSVRTEPADIADYLEELARLRGMPAAELAPVLFENSLASFPGMRDGLSTLSAPFSRQSA